MDQYKVTVLGARRVGKTALVHYMTNMSPYGTHYVPSKEIELRHLKFQHNDNQDIGQCSVALEDTPGFKALDRENSAPDLLEPRICYMWCDDGVRKPGSEDPNKPDDDKTTTEQTPLVGAELKGVSPIDSKLDRQGFIIVYNPLEKDTFEAAKQLMTDLQAKMAKPEDEEEDNKDPPPEDPEDPPELPPHPFVMVATMDDKKKDAKVKHLVTREEGEEAASAAGAPHFVVNSNGKNVRKALTAVIEAIHKVEQNIVYEKEKAGCEKYCGSMSKCAIM